MEKHPFDYACPAGHECPNPSPTSDDDLLAEIRAVRESQERTEKLVNDFLADFAKNPMMKSMASMFGMGKGK